MKPPGSSRWPGWYPAGASAAGSTGSDSPAGRIGRDRSAAPPGPSGYQTGIGTPE